MTTLSRVDSNVHSESAAATHAMAILPVLYSSSFDARSKAVAKVETKNARNANSGVDRFIIQFFCTKCDSLLHDLTCA